MTEQEYLSSLLTAFQKSAAINATSNISNTSSTEESLHSKLVSDTLGEGEAKYIESLHALKLLFSSGSIQDIGPQALPTLESLAVVISSVLAIPGQEDLMAKDIIQKNNEKTDAINSFIQSVIPDYTADIIPSIDLREVNSPTRASEENWAYAMQDNIIDIFNDVYILKDIQTGVKIMQDYVAR